MKIKYASGNEKWVLILILFLLLSNNEILAEEKQDARYIKLMKEYTFHEDGSTEFTYVQQLEYLSYYAIHREYGQTSLIYNPLDQKVDINYAFTIMKDGRKVISPKNAINEVLPHQAASAPAYNYLRRLVITHTGLEIGAVSKLSYTVRSNAGLMPALMGNERILQSAACDEYIIRVKVPNQFFLKFELKNSNVEQVVSKNDSFQTFTWHFKNLPAYSLESNQPHPSQHEPYLLFSTTSMKELYFSFISQEAFGFQLSEKIRNWVDEIDISYPDQLPFILHLQEKIAMNFGTYPLSLEQTNYKVRIPEEVFFSRGGTKAEKAALMTACLQYKGIKAYPIMLSSYFKLNESVGALNAIDDFIVRIHLGNNDIYLPVHLVPDVNLKYSLSKKSMIPVYNGISMFEIKEEADFKNKTTIIGDIKLGKSAHILSVNEAGFNPMLRIIKNGKAGFDNLLAGLTIPGEKESVVDVYKLNSYLSEFELKTELNSSAISHEHEYYFLTLPKYNLGIESWHLDVLIPGRKSVFEIPSCGSETYDYKIKLGKRNSFSKGNYSISEKNKLGEVYLELKIKKRKAYIQKQITLNKRYVDPEGYSELRDLMLLWNSDKFNTLIYKKK